jgi:hypothetical protein
MQAYQMITKNSYPNFYVEVLLVPRIGYKVRIDCVLPIGGGFQGTVHTETSPI